MKLQIMSDLHNEFIPYSTPLCIDNAGADILVLAGDIGVASLRYTYERFISDVCTKFSDVIMILGNHEYYDGSIETSADAIRKSTEHLKNFHLLDNSSINIGGVEFIGSTLWSKIDPLHAFKIETDLNDFNRIYMKSKWLFIEEYNALFLKSKEYLINELLSESPKVVITHHNPTLKVSPEWKNSPYNSAFCSDLSKEILAYSPQLWVFGHTHSSMDFIVGDTRLVCNPRGYEHEQNTSFDPGLIIEVHGNA